MRAAARALRALAADCSDTANGLLRRSIARFSNLLGSCLSFGPNFVASRSAAGVAELADALDSKSSDRKIVWVRSPPPAVSLINITSSSQQRLALTWGRRRNV